MTHNSVPKIRQHLKSIGFAYFTPKFRKTIGCSASYQKMFKQHTFDKIMGQSHLNHLKYSYCMFFHSLIVKFISNHTLYIELFFAMPISTFHGWTKT